MTAPTRSAPAGWPSRTKLDPLRAALLMLMLLTISRLHQHYTVIGKLRPALVLTAAALAYAYVNPRLLAGRQWLKTVPARLVMAIGVLSALSVLFGISVGRSGRFYLDAYSKVLIFAFLLMATVKDARDLRRYIWALVISGGILAWMSITVFRVHAGSGLARLSDLYMYDANDLGLMVVTILPLAILAFQVSRSGAAKLGAAAILVGMGVALARSGSRGGFVGLLAVGAALLIWLAQVSIVKRIAFVLVTVVALAIGAPPGYWDQMRTINDPNDYNRTSPTGRKELAKRGMTYMITHPLFGVGINNFPYAEGTISERARRWVLGDPGIRWAAPHNTYVEVGAELGIPGLVVWVLLLLGGVVRSRRLGRRIPKRWVSGSPDEQMLWGVTVYLPVAYIGFAVSSFFVSFAYLDIAYVLVAIEVGLTIVVGQVLTAREAVQPVASEVPRRSGWLQRGGLAVR